jgi:hypothetical protein
MLGNFQSNIFNNLIKIGYVKLTLFKSFISIINNINTDSFIQLIKITIMCEVIGLLGGTFLCFPPHTK